MNFATVKCLGQDDKCKTCINTGQCTECNSGYKLDITGKFCICATITDCKLCDKPDICNLCLNNKILSTLTVPNQCIDSCAETKLSH